MATHDDATAGGRGPLLGGDLQSDLLWVHICADLTWEMGPNVFPYGAVSDHSAAETSSPREIEVAGRSSDVVVQYLWSNQCRSSAVKGAPRMLPLISASLFDSDGEEHLDLVESLQTCLLSESMEPPPWKLLGAATFCHKPRL